MARASFVRIRVDDADVKRTLARIRAGLEDESLLMPPAETLARVAKRRAPKRTGALRKSIRADRGWGYTRVVADIRYSTYVHWGSKHNPERVPFLVMARKSPAVRTALRKAVQQMLDRSGA